MNYDDSQPNQENSETPFTEETAAEEPTRSNPSVEEAFRNGAKDAREAFERALPKAKEDFSKGIHDIAYAIAYAGAFGTALVKELTPENVSTGFAEGRDAGTKAAQDMVEKQRQKREAAATEEGPDAEPQMV